MAERADVFEQFRYGVETTRGTNVIADKILQSLSIDPQPVEPQLDVDPRGFKAPTGSISVHGKHTNAPVSGKLAFNDLIVALAACGATPVVTTPTSGVLTRDFTVLLDADGPDNFKTLSCDVGSSEGAARMAHAAFQSLNLMFSIDDCTFGGNAIGGRLAEHGVTLDGTPDYIPLVPISPDSWSAYVADNLAGLVSANKLTRCFEASLSIGDRFSPLFVGDASNHSYVGLVEQKNNVLGAINVEQDAYASQYIMGALRSKATKLARIVAIGPEIESVGGGPTIYRYRAEITFPFNFRNPRRGARGNVRSGEYDLRAIFDTTFTSYLKIVVRTAATAADLLPTGVAQVGGQTPDELLGALPEAV